MQRQDAPVLVVALGLATGCAEYLGALRGTPGFSTGVLFWPPPRATSSWIVESNPGGANAPSTTTLGDAARLAEAALRRAGYAEQRWFPIGVSYEHGFAVTTRLERIDDDGSPKSATDRWISPYPDAANLRWLEGSAEPYLPARGRYRVLLVAFTDLYTHARGRPLRLDETTAMDGPSFVPAAFPERRRVPATYRFGVFIYEYEATSADGAGAFVAHDDKTPASTHVAKAGLSALAMPPRTPTPMTHE